MSGNSTTSDIKFKSNFMGSFSAGIFVPPNTIDYNNVFSNFDSLIQDNWAVLVVIVVLICGYVPMVLIARRRDKLDRIMV